MENLKFKIIEVLDFSCMFNDYFDIDHRNSSKGESGLERGSEEDDALA